MGHCCTVQCMNNFDKIHMMIYKFSRSIEMQAYLHEEVNCFRLSSLCNAQYELCQKFSILNVPLTEL